MASHKEVVLVTGATGNTGSAAVHELLKSGKVVVKAGVHHASKAEKLKEAGATVVELDAEDPKSLDAALAGVDRLYLIPSSAENRAEHGRLYADAAKRNHVKQIVLLSVVGAEYKSILFARQFREIEEHVEALGVPYVNLQTVFFQQNLLGFIPQIKNGELPLPIRDGAIPLLDIADIARAATTILTQPIEAHLNKKYALTGPELLTGEQLAKAVSDGLGGKPVKYVDQAPAEAKKIALGWGMPEWQATGMLELYEVFANKLAQVSHDYEKITGKKASTTTEFVKAHAGYFA